MIIWISRALTVAIHERQLAEHGGGIGIRDEALLDSALARPQQLFAHGEPPPDLAALAASLAYGLAGNHPFVDGNKRTAPVCCETFIRLNDANLVADDLALYPVCIGLAEGTLSEDDFAAWLRKHITLASGHRVSEPSAEYAARGKPRAARKTG
jgi:death-on-curing protein